MAFSSRMGVPGSLSPCPAGAQGDAWNWGQQLPQTPQLQIPVAESLINPFIHP